MNPQTHNTHWLFICAASTHVSRTINLIFSEFVVFHWKSSAVSLSDVEAVVCLARGVS